jgi:UDP-N-acetylmuramoyl-tripeptide--D-alanyl-D-alanine ligase
MKKITLVKEDFKNITGSVLYHFDLFKNLTSVTIDSRKVKKNSLFVAIKGDNFDGHNFVKNAVKSGAAAVVIKKGKLKNLKELKVPIVAVKDTTIALGEIANIWRSKLRATVIGITGSNGKTSTKEMIAALLGEKFTVNKTIANNNNQIGVPITIFSTNTEHDFLVLEMGTNHFGEIAYNSRIAVPDYALITNIGSSHLEFFKNKEGVYKEKIALFKITSEKKGLLFINNDDSYLRDSYKEYKNKITFGFKFSPDVKGKLLGYDKSGNAKLKIKYKKEEFEVELPAAGENNAKNFLASAAVALKAGLTKDEIIKASEKLRNFNKRLNVKKLKDFVLVDDTYNANPESMKAAIEFISKFKNSSKKIIILGDMFELGSKEKKLHEELSSSIVKNKIDVVILIGKRMKFLSSKLDHKKISNKYFTSRKRLNEFLKGLDFSSSVILVKGSRGMKMEEFINTITEKK